MDGTRTLLVALLLCLALLGGVAVADDPGDAAALQEQTDDSGDAVKQTDDSGDAVQQTDDTDRGMSVLAAGNTSEYLAPPPDRIDRTDSRTAGLDVAAAVEADAGALESAYVGEATERRYAAATTDAERETALEEAVERLSERTAELRSTERTAIRQYNDGTIGPHELLRTLTTIHRAAEVTTERLRWAETTANDLGMDSTAERASAHRGQLVPTGGPIRAELDTVAAAGGSLGVRIETAGDGMVLAAVDRTDDTYLREAHDPEARDTQTADRYNGSPLLALERVEQLYPWVAENDLGISASPIGPVFDRVYRFSIPHPHGELETYLDSGSEDVVAEFQQNDVGALPIETTRTTADGHRLVVATTRGGGPLGISVVDAATESPVDAEIELNGERIGSTGGDRLWTVSPRGTVSINATHAEGTVSLETAVP